MVAAAADPVARRERVEAALRVDESERRTASRSLLHWAYRYLPEHVRSAPGAVHRALCDDLGAMVRQEPIEGEVRSSLAIAWPRSHGKTTWSTVAFVLWVIHEWRTMPQFGGRPPFIVIVSNSADKARDRVLDVRDELMTNDALRRDYGPADPPRGADQKWTEKDFTTRDGVRVRAAGASTSVRGFLRGGRRPSLIIVDDVETDEGVLRWEQREKLERWLLRGLIPTGIEGELLTVVLGTVLHADSVLARLLKPDRNETWLKRRYAAQWDLRDGVRVPTVSGSHVLWPAVWPAERLARRRRLIGSLAYQQEYLNQPIDD